MKSIHTINQLSCFTLLLIRDIERVREKENKLDDN